MRDQQEQNRTRLPKAEHCPRNPEIAGLTSRNSSMLGIQKEQRTRGERGRKNGKGRPNFAPVEKARAGGRVNVRKRIDPYLSREKAREVERRAPDMKHERSETPACDRGEVNRPRHDALVGSHHDGGGSLVR